jgi:ATP-dependent HslUV protease ATP-binding subunit HslU
MNSTHKKMENATPSEIVAYLDEYIIGQKKAKRTIALALRTRYRRMQLDSSIRDEVMPKNILMIGSTGVGKTEIARRLAKLMNLPFVKVEASKYTEVGFVGRDVESMVRDLANYSLNMVKKEHSENSKSQISEYVIDKIVDILFPKPKGISGNQEREESYFQGRNRMRNRVISGEMDDKKIEIEVPKKGGNALFSDDNSAPVEVIKIQESLSGMFEMMSKNKEKRELTIKEAKEILKSEATDKILDKNLIRDEALKRTEEEGIIFLDEIDKVAVGSNSSRQDPSKEGVQRDLLPIVEGSTVNTKLGQVKTDHILFIAAGAFHLSKPSDLIPELQGRFPLRVELENLTEETLYKILTQPKNSLLKQYKALLEVEKVNLEFDDSAIKALANISQKANDKTEDIGARRLHTVIEKVLEPISFEAEKYSNETVTITEETVKKELDIFTENEDIAHYIL